MLGNVSSGESLAVSIFCQIANLSDSDGLFDRRGDRWGDPGHFVSSHSKLYLWGVLGFPPPTFRGRVEGTNLYWAPGMECRREPWCVTKIVKTTLGASSTRPVQLRFKPSSWDY